MTDSLEATDAASAAVAKAPRVALSDLEAKIAYRYHCTGEKIAFYSDEADDPSNPDIPDGLDILSVCMLVMQNGFVVIGKSAPASPENFDADLGRQLAYEDAVRQIWLLEGYLLRETLYAAKSS